MAIGNMVAAVTGVPLSTTLLACQAWAAPGTWSAKNVADKQALCSSNAARTVPHRRQAPGWALVAAIVVVRKRILVQRRAGRSGTGSNLRLSKPSQINKPKMLWGKKTFLDETKIQQSRQKKKMGEPINMAPTTQIFKDIQPAVRSYYYSQCPPEDPNLPEIAIFGISNVGKSSFINYFCNRRLLSTISRRPGHTRLIHHYLIDRSWYLVDMPGIGHAEAPGKVLQSLDKMIAAYLKQRMTLIHMLYLVDASEPPQQIDLDAIKWLTEANVYLSIVFTKTDIKNRRTPDDPVMAMTRALTNMQGSPFRLGVNEVPAMFSTSSKAKVGREPILDFLDALREQTSPSALAKLLKPKQIEPPKGAVEMEMVVRDRKGRRKKIDDSMVPTGIR